MEASLEALEEKYTARSSIPQEEEPVEDTPVEDTPVEDTPVEEDTRDAEIAKLKNEMEALKGRTAPAQRMAEEFRKLYDSEKLKLEETTRTYEDKLASLRKEIEESKTFDAKTLLTEDEAYLFDEEQLNLISKIARESALSSAPKVDVEGEMSRYMEQQKLENVNAYRDAYLTSTENGLNELTQLAQDPAFQNWTYQEGNESFDPTIRAFLSTSNTKDVDRYGRAIARMISKYKGKTIENDVPTDANTSSLSQASQRRPKQLTGEDVYKKLALANKLSRSRNPNDRARAKKLIDETNNL